MHAGNRCRQTLASKPRVAVVQHTQKVRRKRKIQRKAFRIGYSPSQLISRTWRHMCPHNPSEREISDSEGDASKVETQKRKHCFFPHFPKDRNCDICLRTQITRGPCRGRNEGSIPRAAKYGDLITADHKVLNEGSESRNNH